MKRVELGAIVLYDGGLHEVVGLSNGEPSAILRPVGKDPCPTCGSHFDLHLNIEAPLFQEHVEPVRTVEQ